MIAQFWTIYLINSNKMRHRVDTRLFIDEVDVAEMMSLLKKARKVHGSGSPDNHVDDVGYSALAAMMDPKTKAAIAAPVQSMGPLETIHEAIQDDDV